MNIRPLRGGLAVLAALTVTAGCTGGERAAAPSSPAAARDAGPPGDELIAAMRRTAAGSFRFTVEMRIRGVVLTGAADPAAKVAVVSKPGGDRTYRGTLDLSRARSSSVADDLARPVHTPGPGDQLVLPTGSPTVPPPTPFEAQVDTAGRLIRFTVVVHAAGLSSRSSSVRYTDFGAKVEVPRPALDEVIEPQDDPYLQQLLD